MSGQQVWVEQSLQDYTLVDINLSQPIIDDTLDVYLRVSNLLDENYYQSQALPQAGREVFAGIKWRI